MEFLTTLISLILFILLIAVPIIISIKVTKSNITYPFLSYLLLTLTLSSMIMILLGWWSDKSNQLLLSYYGYNFNGMNQKEYYRNVSIQNINRVKEIERSWMGIGWPLKVIFEYIFYLPYIFIVYVLLYKEKTKRY